MRGKLMAIAVFASIGLSCGGSTPAPSGQSVTPEVTFRELLQVQRPTEVQLSPDGTRIAFVTVTADLDADVMRSTLWLVDAAGGAPARISAPDTAVTVMRWSPAGDRLAYVANAPAGSRLQVVDAAGALLQSISGAAIDAPAWSADGTRLAFTALGTAPDAPQLWTADVATGRARQLVHEEAAVLDPQWSPDGRTIAYVRLPGDVPDGQFFPTIQLFDVDAGTSRTAAGPDEFVSAPRWSPDGTRLAYLAHSAGDDAHRALAFDHPKVLTLADGTKRTLAPNVAFAARRPTWSGDGKTLFFEAFTDLTGQLFAAPATGGDASALTDVPGVAHVASYDRGATSVAFVNEDPQNPPEVFVAYLAPPLEPRRVTDLNRALREKSTEQSRIVRWKSSDGLDVDGVLLLPPDFHEGAPVPTLVVPHGGPATLVDLAYPDSWLLGAAPAWTSGGWAVFYPNYRGSTHRDEAFALAEIGQFGRGDFDDVQTGVDALVAAGLADPARLALAGWSFGGFLGGWAATHTTRYRAISAGAGPYDWPTTYAGTVDQFTLRVYLQGTPATNPQEFRRASVSTYVDRAAVPTLLFGAEADDLVPAGQAQAFFDALQALGVASELRLFADEPHELQRPRDQLEKLVRERDWVLRFTPPAPVSTVR